MVWLARLALLGLVWQMAVLSFGPVRRWLHWDKAEHFCGGYAAAILILAAFPRLPVWGCGILVVAAAGGAELVQTQIAGRAASLEDFAASALGAAAALAPVALVQFRQAVSRSRPADGEA